MSAFADSSSTNPPGEAYDESVAASHAQVRNRSIQLAVLTSAFSKLGGVFLRLVSIPVAIRILGLDLFGVYTVITMAVWMIDLLHIGIGPALTKELSRAVAENDREKEKTVFSTAFFLSSALTILAALVVALVVWMVPIPTLFGEKFAPMEETMQRAIWIGLVILTVESICVISEMARDGYMETRINNAWGAFGNVLGALLLLAGIVFFPSIEFLLIAVNGSIALSKVGNLIHFLRQRPWQVPRLRLFSRPLVRPLATDGFQFSVTYILSAMVEYNLMAFLIGRYAGPEAVGVFNVMVTVHFSLTSAVHMFTNPYWPAVLDAKARGDVDWIRRTGRRSQLAIVGFGVACGLGLILLGPWAFRLWLGEEFYTDVSANFQMNRIALLAFSGYFICHVWRHLNQVVALGLGRVTAVCFGLVAESVLLVVLAGFALLKTSEITWIYAAMAMSILLCSSWLFPMLFRKGIEQSE